MSNETDLQAAGQTAELAAERQPIEHWREAKKTEPWLYAALKAFRRWGIGSLATEAEYDEAAREVAGIRVGIG